MSWSDRKAQLLRSLSDKNGIKLLICRMLTRGPRTLDELYKPISKIFGITRVAVENHVKDLLSTGHLFQEDPYKAFYLTCPDKMKEFLEFLHGIAPELLEAAESNRRSDHVYDDFITSSDVDKGRKRPRLDANLDYLFVHSFGPLHPKLKKRWMTRAIRNDLRYDFNQLSD